MTKTAIRPRGMLAGALALDRAVYRRIAETPAALAGALLVVIVATALAGAGGLIWTYWGGAVPSNFVYTSDPAGFLVRSVVVGGALQVALVSSAWSSFRFHGCAFGERAPLLPFLRALGFACADGGATADLPARHGAGGGGAGVRLHLRRDGRRRRGRHRDDARTGRRRRLRRPCADGGHARRRSATARTTSLPASSPRPLPTSVGLQTLP
ncbi:MAG: hypothetical protein U0531_13435 [Dehalococcoidia bacterium]